MTKDTALTQLHELSVYFTSDGWQAINSFIKNLQEKLERFNVSINDQTTVGDVRVGLQYDYRFLDFVEWDTENPASEFTTFYFHHASHSIIFFDEGRLLMSAHTEPGPTYTTGYNDPPGQVFRLYFKVKENIPFMSILGMKTKIEFNENSGVWSIDDPGGFNYLAETQNGNYWITP